MAGDLSPQISILSGGEHRLLTDIGRVDPSSLASYVEHGGYAGLRRAIQKLGAEATVEEIGAAGLRGRGGAGFPTAEKWRVARQAEAERKVVIANLMAADPASLGDRALAEGNPHLILEGLLIAAFAIGASEAIIAVRRDWQVGLERFRQAVSEAEAARLAGYLVLGTDVSVQVTVREGSGA
ncbi:MAG: NADH-quinone oxidoreductase subunit F, partial [Chloroflexota bacterium]|nr:NADH-quinone oxidoreductase subunit F [Chloroflexota bacterium]